MTAYLPSPRTLAALGLVAVLAACGGSSAGIAVRNGPQAVHPSPSALAQEGFDTADTTVSYDDDCGGDDEAPCAAPIAATITEPVSYEPADDASYGDDDGSTPIID